MRDELQAAINAKVVEERRILEGRINELTAITSGASASTIANPNGVSGPRRARARRSVSRSTKGTRVPAKYRGPKGEAWSGRGLTPRWLVALEKAGKKRETYLIKN
jgi:DNA-binding protein H-NS